MTKAFIIRFHYAKDDPRFTWRFEYFKSKVLPRIHDQTIKDFDICIRCNPWHDELFKNLGLKIFHIDEEVVRYKGSGRKKYFHDFVLFERCIGLEKYDLQMGLDSDDLIEPNYVERFIQEIENIKEKFPMKTIHLCFQPQSINIRNGQRKIGEFHEYTPMKGSAFMALYQPKKENYKFIYCESHMTLWKHADFSKVLPRGYCYATIHDINESTGK